MPRISFWAAVLFLGAVGAIVSAAFSQHTKREAFIAGILAPSLVANLIGGYQEGSIRRPVKAADASFFSVISSAEASERLPPIFKVDGMAGAASSRKFDVEWALNRQDAIVAKVKFELLRTPDDPQRITYYVSPNFSGTIEPKQGYNYIIVDQGPPMLIPQGDSQMVIHANVRTSLTNDFLWGLGSPRQLKIQDTRVEFLPISQSQNPKQ